MKLLAATEIQLQWSDLNHLTYHPQPQTTRSGGAHVSDVLKVLREYSISHNRYTEDDKEDEMPLRILLGLAFEEAAARLYPTMHWQPGEVAWDGLAGSPDGIDTVEYPHAIPWSNTSPFPLPDGYWVGGALCVDEFKYTGKSQRIKGRKPVEGSKELKLEDLKDIRTEWLWMQQGQAYINLLRRMLPDAFGSLSLCRFHVCWKFGAYQWPMRETYMRYLVQFSEEELRGNWALMKW